jgi:DNA-binding transcriptional ArsR family regulator
MENKFILLSLDDPKSKNLSDILGNKTCKKIIDLLAETNELSEKDISDRIKAPLNTVEYNLKKLIDLEIVEKTKNFFWSVKGKKIPMYRLSNKSIVISPKSSVKSKLKSILPVALIGGAVTFLIGLIKNNLSGEKLEVVQDEAMLFAAKSSNFDSASLVSETATTANFFFTTPADGWFWFFGGVVFTLVLFTILNWRKL